MKFTTNAILNLLFRSATIFGQQKIDQRFYPDTPAFSNQAEITGNEKKEILKDYRTVCDNRGNIEFIMNVKKDVILDSTETELLIWSINAGSCNKSDILPENPVDAYNEATEELTLVFNLARCELKDMSDSQVYTRSAGNLTLYYSSVVDLVFGFKDHGIDVILHSTSFGIQCEAPRDYNTS